MPPPGTQPYGIIVAPVQLDADQVWQVGSLGQIRTESAITLSGHTLTFNSLNGNIDIRGAIGGAGAVIKTGLSTLLPA